MANLKLYLNRSSLHGENPIYSAVDVNTVPIGGYSDRPSTDKTSNLEMVQILLVAGANPNLRLKLQPTYRYIKGDRGGDRKLNIGATPLLRTVKAHDVPAVKLLLEYGALPNLPKREGNTPLMVVAGWNETVEYLARYGADLVVAVTVRSENRLQNCCRN